MNPRIVFLSLALLLLAGCSPRTSALPDPGIDPVSETSVSSVNGTFKVDPFASKVRWEGRKMLVPSKHMGSLMVEEGRIEMEKGIPTGGSVILDMDTINAEDQTGDMKAKLEGHLKSADFFDVGKFPTATLAIKEASQSAPGQYKVNADLTIKGVTKPIEFDATAKMDGDKLGTEARIEIDRTQWDIKFGSGSFFKGLGDKVIDDKISFEISLVAGK